MAPPVKAPRPAALDGCWASWTEQDIDNVLRTDMDSGTVKSRRRFTGRQRKAQVEVTLPRELHTDFVTWFTVNCRQGAIPTLMKTPYGTEEYWAFSEPPAISWPDRAAFTVTANLYQLSGW